MKILIAGEASVHLSNFCRGIHPFVKEIIVVTERPIQISEAQRSYIVSFRGLNFVKWFFEFRKLKAIISKESPDIIHVHQINRLAFFVCKAIARHIPVVATAWGSDVLLVPSRNFLYKKTVGAVIKQAVKVTADAQNMIDEMMKLDPSGSKYTLLQYGIDPITPGHKENIIFSNRLHQPLYNIKTIIELFTEFNRNHPEWQLNIGGSGGETEKLKAHVKSLEMNGKIHFLGWLDKKLNNENYAKAAIYISIPQSDGTSVSLLEAMSANCIPVVSDLAVSREWIMDGINGIIYRPGINPFEEAIKMNKEKCFQVNQEKINQRALRTNTSKAFVDIYKTLVKQHA